VEGTFASNSLTGKKFVTEEEMVIQGGRVL
jgi:hypothetical protein